MMQNNPMGAMMPQGVAPAASTGLNFQSDPSMRAQFKGFMSGMQAKQPAPMAPMMQQPLPMPPSMQNIDIFQPSMPMQMAMGGAVPRSAQIAGQPHMLSYITPGEAMTLKAMGGSGAPGPGGIPSFFVDDDDEEAELAAAIGGADTSDFYGGGGFGGGGGSFGDDSDYYAAAGTAIAPQFQSAAPPPSSPEMDALSRAIANTAQVNAAQQARQRATADPALSQRLAEVQLADVTPGQIGGRPQNLTGTSRAVDAITDPNRAFGEFGRNIDLLGDPFNPNDIQAMQNPVSNFVNVATPASRPEGLGLSSIGVEEANPTMFGGSNVGGIDESLVTTGTGAPSPSADVDAATLFDRSLDDEYVSVPGGVQNVRDAYNQRVSDAAIPADVQRLADLMDKRTTVTLTDPDKKAPKLGTPGAATTGALDQLARRAGRASQGISGFFERITGFNPAGRMYQDIVNKGYEPIYDNRGQIIGTRNPETGQIGAGSRPSAGGALGGGGGAPQMSVADQVAAALKRLGIGQDDEGDKAPPMVGPPEVGPGLPILPPVNPPTEAAQVGNPLGLGYGQISGLTPNLNSAADDFLRLLGGGR